MYNNRRNNRFSIFIAAIIVSLLVLLTGCASTKKETDLAKPVAEDSSNPVTLTVYLTAHYANPDTHCPIYEKLLDYQKENPNITIQFVSPKEGDTAEREAEIHQLNTEILSGKGPDLFIMEGNRLTNVNLFPDIEKSMMNGAFLDLTDVMDSNEFTAENFYMPLLDAGKLKGKQYILPLCFSVPALTSAESVLKDSGFDMQAASKSLAATMDELLRVYKEKPMLVVMDFSMTSALSQPIIDYKNHTINLDTVSCRQTLAYEKEFRTGEISYEMQNGLFDSFNPEVVQDYFANGEPFASLDPSYMTVGLLRQCAALGIKTVTLPIPNELGGVTAEIGSYAMGNRNTKHPTEVKALLAYKMKKNLQSNILLLPALIAGFFCYLFPILIAFGKSFFLGTGTDFVGIQNYVDLFENEAFSLAVRNLFHLWAIIVPVNLVIGIFIAEVYIKLRKEKLCLFFLVPSILPAACVVTIASSILQKSPSQWGETPVAFYVFLIIVLWKTLGFSILIFIVAIKSIESEIIDAAMLDGVNPLQCFWYIKLPIIKSSLLICGILTIYNSFRCFREAYLIGGSHPNEQLYSIQHFLQNNFMNMNYARLEAASVLVVLFVGAVVLIGMYLARKKRNN